MNGAFGREKATQSSYLFKSGVATGTKVVIRPVIIKRKTKWEVSKRDWAWAVSESERNYQVDHLISNRLQERELKSLRHGQLSNHLLSWSLPICCYSLLLIGNPLFLSNLTPRACRWKFQTDLMTGESLGNRDNFLYSSASLFVLIGILRQFTPYCEGTLEDDDYG